jgi:hypothetical protein
MSFWYLANPLWFDEANLEANYTGVVNDRPVTIAGRYFDTGMVKIESIEMDDSVWERAEVAHLSMKMVRVSLLIDKKTWLKKYENVSNLFIAFSYVWEKANSGEKECTKMRLVSATHQPEYVVEIESSPGSGIMVHPKEATPHRIFCTMYAPSPKNEGSIDDPIYVQDPHKAIQFFGTREECFRLNPDSEPTEVSEPMYLDKNGFVLYPDPATGKVDTHFPPKLQVMFSSRWILPRYTFP